MRPTFRCSSSSIITYAINPALQIGASCDFWNNYAADIKRNADLGCNSMRLSLEWHRIEPYQSVVDEAAISRYHEILDCLQQ
jgi:beta-glucosidase